MAKKKKNTVTLETFKSWLTGVEDMQPEGWTPNAEQWKKIREKIDMIEDEEDDVPQVQQSPQPYIPSFPIVRTPPVSAMEPIINRPATPVDINNPPPPDGSEFL